MIKTIRMIKRIKMATKVIKMTIRTNMKASMIKMKVQEIPLDRPKR